MDTSVVQFYPTLFVLATDVMDMLGDMVWERIRRRAEFAEDGTLICSLRGFYLLYKSISLSLSLSPAPPPPPPPPHEHVCLLFLSYRYNTSYTNL